MLTKNDFDQIGKLVQKIVRQEVKVEVKDSTRTLDSQIRLSRMQVQQDISELDDRMKNVEVRLDDVGGKIYKLDKKTTRIGKDILKKLEQHVGLPTGN